MTLYLIRRGVVVAILALPISVLLHSHMKQKCSLQTWLHNDHDSDWQSGDGEKGTPADDFVSLLQNVKEPSMVSRPGGPIEASGELLVQSSISGSVGDAQKSSALDEPGRATHVSEPKSVPAFDLPEPLLLQKLGGDQVVETARHAAAQGALAKSHFGKTVGLVFEKGVGQIGTYTSDKDHTPIIMLGVCFIVIVVFLMCVFLSNRRVAPTSTAEQTLLANVKKREEQLKGQILRTQQGMRSKQNVTTSVPPPGQMPYSSSVAAPKRVASSMSYGPSQQTQLPGSSSLPPPVRVAAPPTSALKFAVPLADLLELTYLSTGYFNVEDDGGEPIFHVEVRVTPAGRILEVSKVYELGNFVLVASVGEANPAGSQRPSQMQGLPPEILEVRMMETKHSTIESYGRGSYQIVQDGRKAFIIDGDAVELEITVSAAATGRPVAQMQRKGLIADQGLEVLELSIVPGAAGGDPLHVIICILAVVVLRAWPVRQSPAEEVYVPPQSLSEQTSRGGVHQMFSDLVGVNPASPSGTQSRNSGPFTPQFTFRGTRDQGL